MARAVELIVEDGSIVAGANSFVTEAQINAYLTARGYPQPTGTDAELDAIAVLGISAMDYLAVLPWKGEPVSPTQTTPWPRKNLGFAYPENYVPTAVLTAQMNLALMVSQGVELMPGAMNTGVVTKEQIGPIVMEYSETTGVKLSASGLPVFPGIAAMLEPWLIDEPTPGVTGPLLFTLGC